MLSSPRLSGPPPPWGGLPRPAGGWAPGGQAPTAGLGSERPCSQCPSQPSSQPNQPDMVRGPARRSGFLRHTALSAEGCCRQALTRFAAPRCAGPDRRAQPRTLTDHRTWLLQASVSGTRRGARAAESARLEIVCGATHRGFKSHPLRQKIAGRGMFLLSQATPRRLAPTMMGAKRGSQADENIRWEPNREALSVVRGMVT